MSEILQAGVPDAVWAPVQTEWDTHALAQLHTEGHLNASYYDVIHDGTAPDGSPVELIAYKPSPPDVYAIKAVQDNVYGSLDAGQKAMANGAFIGGIFLGVSKAAESLTRGIENPTLRIIARRGLQLVGWGSILSGVAGCLTQSVGPSVTPSLPPPGHTELEPTLTVAQETGSMIAQTQEGRAFYEALNTHGVDPSACSPDVLGSLVIEKELPLGVVSDLTTIATDALANTPEPDHLKAMVCNVVDGPNGTKTVEFYFTSDQDHTGDGKPDIFIPSQAKVLLPGELIDGVAQVVAPAIEDQSPAGSSVSPPDWSPAGGEIPSEIRGLITVEEQSIRYSLVERNINPDRVRIHPVFRGSGDDFRMGSGVTNVDQTIAFYPQFDDSTDGFAWRPDLRLIDRPWHWEQVPLPPGVDGKIEVVFDPDSEAPQFVALTPDESRMIGWFNNITGQWLTAAGKELMPPPTLTPEPTATEVGAQYQKYAEAIIKAQGGGWENTMENFDSLSFFKFLVYELITKDIQITSVTGDLLATAKISARVLYIKPDGSVGEGILPLYLQRPDGVVVDEYEYAIDKEKLAGVNWIPHEVEWLKETHWGPGNIREAILTADPDQFYKDYPMDNTPGHRNNKASMKITSSYIKEREGQFKKFIETGDLGSDKIIMPLTVDQNNRNWGFVELK